MPGMQGVLIDHVLKSCSFELQPAERASAIDYYVDKVKDAATAALAKFDEYIPKALLNLKHRLMYSPARPPLPLPPPARKGQYDAGDICTLLGAHDPASNVLQLLTDHSAYVAGWASLPPEVKALPIGQFWRHERVLNLFGESRAYANVALWYATRQTSSTAVERAFGILRHLERGSNLSMTDDSVDVEMLARCNGWIVDEMVARVAADKRRVSR